MTKTITEHAKRRIFIVSVLAIFTSGLSFALRGSVAGDIQAAFLDSIDVANSAMMVGEILGVAFLGFAFTLFFGSPLLNIIGMGRMLWLAGASFISGTLITVGAPMIVNGPDVFWALWVGMGLTGLGWGFTECAVNPLTSALYPNEKTHRLNILHAWWPAGIVVGGLSGLGLGALNFSWEIKFLIILIPTFAFLIMLVGVKFPNTERADAGVGFGDMIAEIGRRPAFLIWFAAMFLTAATELAPGQWVDITLSHTIGMPGIAILVYVSALMFVMRHFAGALAHRLSNAGLLLISCVLSLAGLYFLSLARGPVDALLAATIWGTGVCFLWPTMLATTSERFPRGGEFFMGLMGSAGALSIYFVLPMLGGIFDKAKIEAAGGTEVFNTLRGEALENVIAEAAQISFQTATIFPIILIGIFGMILLYDYRQKKAQRVVLQANKV
nr:MFS transporter [uncultured Amphritea sp.]